jgi:propanol-preferring alcohol dehydrogenase
MKAALLREIGKPLVIEDVPLPELGPGEVLVKVHTCGICRTDLHIQDGLAYVPSLPHIPGHEPAGVVAQTGSGVTSITVGQRVAPHLFGIVRK